MSMFQDVVSDIVSMNSDSRQGSRHGSRRGSKDYGEAEIKSSFKDGEQDISTFRILCISSLYFHLGLATHPLRVSILPVEMERMFPEHSSLAITVFIWAWAIGGIASSNVATYSDICLSKWGRRRPFIALGVLIQFVGTVGMWWSSHIDGGSMYLISNFVASYGFGMIYSIVFALLNDQLSIHQLGYGGGWISGVNLLGAVFGFLFILVFIKSNFTWFYVLLTFLPVPLLLLYLFVPETPLRAIPADHENHSVYSKAWRVLFNPEERDFLRTILLQVCQHAESALTPFKLLFVRDMMNVHDVQTQNQLVGWNAITIAAVAIPVALAVGKFCDNGDMMWRQKFCIYLWCAVSICQYVFGIWIGVIESYAMQVLLFRLGAILGGIAVGFYMAPSNSLSMSCLANQDETAVAKTLRMPAGALGLVLGSTCIGMIMSLFQNATDNTYNFGGYCTMFLLSAFWVCLGTYIVSGISRLQPRDGGESKPLVGFKQQP